MLNKEVRIVVAGDKGFHNKDRLKLALDRLIADIFLVNEGVTDEDELLTKDHILLITNGEVKTLAAEVKEYSAENQIDLQEIAVEWDRGKKAFFDNCGVLGMRSTHAIIFTGHSDEGMKTLVKDCLSAGSRVRVFTTAV
ncbi:hypothetical protein pEaSNUABM37_00155 [Erwinia phage pEa_SNUABM_37]|nr:hypothetical protein pEaSNUABM37_00155 [Erwinia phage pEa_SNUABM_37]QXO10625.1 hypothetical protein pEaSNUABM48_00155 [Erwinia phage pEa_SNUABM_48]